LWHGAVPSAAMASRSTSGTPAAPARARRVDPRIAETQRLVKEATLDLIAEIGFEGTTVELIAERSGVSRTTIYRHWPDPSVLFLEAFDPTTTDRQPPPSTGDFGADLDAYIHHVAERLNDERFAAALAAQVDKARRDPLYRAAHLHYAVVRNDHGVNIFRAGIADGTLRDDIDPDHETDLILGFLVFQRLMKYRRLDEAIVTALRDGVLARCIRPATRRRRDGH
jgi:TetR/AcrR family transcriptional regulator, regulator of autoinduction and epiphytic fitness